MNAEKKMELEQLLHSDNYEDRIKAAEQGYGLDILIADEDEDVYNVVINYLNNNHYDSVFDWAKNNNISINIKSWAYSDNVNKRYEVARAGYHLDILYDDEDSDVRDAVYDYLINYSYASIVDWADKHGIYIDKDEWLHSDDDYKIAAVTFTGYGLDILMDDYDNIADSDSIVCDSLDYLGYESIFDWANDNDVELDIDEWSNSWNRYKRIQCVKYGYNLDILICDNESEVRNEVYDYLRKHNYKSVFDWAKDNGIELDIDEWVHSDDWRKRLEVARVGYGLDVLYDDEDSDVRDAAQNYLKKHNYKSISDWMNDNNINTSIDTLLYSKYHRDRCKVAKQGYRLDILVNDDDWQVRTEVAKQGYRLDILICDKDKDVRDEVQKYLKEHNYNSILDWAKDNNVEINLNEWVHSNSWRKRREVAKLGYRLDVLFDDKEYNVDYEVRKYLSEHNYNTILDYVKDNNVEIDLNEWVKSSSVKKRELVAKQGYRLDILAYDNDNDVRYEARNYLEDHNYKSIFEWAKDNNVEIDLNKWVHSSRWRKRHEVAKIGYRLDVLAYDENEDIRNAAQNYLKDHNYKSVFEWANDNNIDIDKWLQSDNWHKKLELAKNGYRLDNLICDNDSNVCNAVLEYLNEHNYKSIFDWANDNGIEINLDEWLHSDDWHKRREVAKAGYKLDVLILDENKTIRNTAQNYLKEHNYKSVFDWVKDTSNTNTNQVDLSDTISNFIDGIENSSMLALQTNLDSIDDFFNNDSAQIDIVTVDTKIPIITITKLKEEEYKFQLNVTDNAMSSNFTSTDKFNKLLDLAISELNENSEFYKYVDDLNNCL